MFATWLHGGTISQESQLLLRSRIVYELAICCYPACFPCQAAQATFNLRIAWWSCWDNEIDPHAVCKMGLVETVYLLLQLPRCILLLRIYERPSNSLWEKKKSNIPPSVNSRAQQLKVTQQTKKFWESKSPSPYLQNSTTPPTSLIFIMASPRKSNIAGIKKNLRFHTILLFIMWSILKQRIFTYISALYEHARK
jgi:hypothetical protein